MEYRIKLQGCDDKTMFKMELSKEELAVVEEIALKSQKISTYGCMPRLYIIKNEENFEDEIDFDF